MKQTQRLVNQLSKSKPYAALRRTNKPMLDSYIAVEAEAGNGYWPKGSNLEHMHVQRCIRIHIHVRVYAGVQKFHFLIFRNPIIGP